MRKLTPGLVCLLALAALAPAQDVDTETVRIFVFAGQSNMEGADTRAADIDRYAAFKGAGKPLPKVRYWYSLGRPGPKSDSKGFVAMGPDHHGRFGPELMFAREVTRRTTLPIAIVKCAWGGTTLAHDWNPDEPSDKRLFARTLELIRKAQADLTKRGLKHRVEAFVWHQGENDMLNRKLMHGYGERLQAFIARWRKELKAPDLKWYVGEISDKGIWGLDHRRNMQIVRKQQRAVTDADPHAWFVETSHLPFAVMRKGQPHYHFGTEGQLHHGVAYADAWLKTIRFPVQAFDFIAPVYGISPYRHGTTVRVFVLAGQRSAEGDGTNAHAARLPRVDAPFHYRIAGGLDRGFRPMGRAGLRNSFGPEISLASTLKRGLPGEHIAIIKVTHSAAALADWLPNPSNASQPQYEGAVTFIRDALKKMADHGAKPSLEAVFWIPGEHDCWWGPFRKRYAADLTTLIQAMRKDLEVPDLAWVVSEMPNDSRWGTKRLDELDAQIRKVAAADPRVWFVPTDTIKTPKACITFGTTGTIALGKLLAQHYLKEVKAKR